MKRTPGQSIKIHHLINRLGISGDKVKLVEQFTKNRESSTTELLESEADQLIKHLESLNQKADKMRKKIISMAHKMRWQIDGTKVDIARIDAWCRKYGAPAKGFNDYTYNELPKLVTQFGKVYKSYLEGLRK